MNDSKEGTSKSAKRRGLLLASLALNLFLIGVVAGPFLAHRPFGGSPHGFGPPPPPSPDLMIERMADQLPAPDAATVRSIYANEKTNIQEHHAAMRKAFHRLTEILSEEKPDVKTLQAVLDDIDAASHKLHDSMGQALQRVASEISVESRRKLAEAMERMPHAGGMPPQNELPHDGEMPPPPPPEMR